MGFITKPVKKILGFAAPIVGGIVGGPIGAGIGGAIGGAVQGGNVLKNAAIGGATGYFGAKIGGELFAPEVAETAKAAGAAAGGAAASQTFSSLLKSKVVEMLGQTAANHLGTSLGIVGTNLFAQKVMEGFQPPMPPTFSNGGEISQYAPIPSFEQLKTKAAQQAQLAMGKELNSAFRLRNPLNRPFFMGSSKNLSGEIPFSIRRKKKSPKKEKKEHYLQWVKTARIK